MGSVGSHNVTCAEVTCGMLTDGMECPPGTVGIPSDTAPKTKPSDKKANNNRLRISGDASSV